MLAAGPDTGTFAHSLTSASCWKLEHDPARFAVGAEVPTFERTTGLANWNRFAAVNDEFIPVHMDDEAARATGQRAAFGMGNLRISYLHNALEAWLGGAGTVVDFSCRFRGLDNKGDTLLAGGTVDAVDNSGGAKLVHLELHVTNQDGIDTTPGTATVQLWDDDGPQVLPAPIPDEPSGLALPGVHLSADEIDRIGEESEPVTSWPVDANDIRRWAIATHWPEPAPAELLDDATASDSPWGGLVAPRDLDPFAWQRQRPWAGPWLRGMSTEPGTRVLNGGQRNRYFRSDPPGRPDHRCVPARRRRREGHEARTDDGLHHRAALDEPGRRSRASRHDDQPLLLITTERGTGDFGCESVSSVSATSAATSPRTWSRTDTR